MKDEEKTKEQLIEELRRYKISKKHNIMIIFDAWQTGVGVRKEYNIKGIKEFQVVQNTKDKITVFIVIN